MLSACARRLDLVAATNARKRLLRNAQGQARVLAGAVEARGAFDLFYWRLVHGSLFSFFFFPYNDSQEANVLIFCRAFSFDWAQRGPPWDCITIPS